jgi:hypothetical protein
VSCPIKIEGIFLVDLLGRFILDIKNIGGTKKMLAAVPIHLILANNISVIKTFNGTGKNVKDKTIKKIIRI